MDFTFKTPQKAGKSKDKVEIPASPFLKQIGYGSGVAVYKLVRSPISDKLRSPWAIKKLIKRSKTNVELASRLCEEAETLRKLSHENIVGFRAFVKGPDGRNILAMEECKSCLGDLIEERSEDNLPPFETKTIEKVASDIIAALSYLHNTALILHCDIKSYNVLIKGNFAICKLCDFGVCMPLTKSGVLDVEKAGEDAQVMGTEAWCSPEILDFPQVITDKVDIYALGLVIWEMIALAPPVDDAIVDSMDESTDSIEISVKRTRPALPDVDLSDDYASILEIYYCCTHQDYKQRPNASVLNMIISEMKQTD